MDFEVDTLRDGDEEQRHALLRQAFGGTDPYEPDDTPFPRDPIAAAYDGDRLIGTVATLDFTQNFGRRMIPCGGVSGVVIAPEARGHGVAKALLVESFRRMGERGQVISSLYPTTSSLYRGAGYEIAGWFSRRTVPLTLVAASTGVDRWERVELGDPRIRPIQETMATRHQGWITRGPAVWHFIWARVRRQTGTNRFVYVGFRGTDPVAAVVYRYIESAHAMYELDAEQVWAVDSDALGATFSFLASNGTTATEFRTTIPPHLLALHIPEVQRTRPVEDWPWMLRLVDVGGAMTARAWPENIDIDLSFDVIDETIAANHGGGRLLVADGQASWEAGGAGRIQVAVQDLAAIYSGFSDPAALAEAGRLVGATAADIVALTVAFAGHPSLPLFF